jgi:hypothetical protein
MNSQVLLRLALGLIGAACVMGQTTEAPQVRTDGVYYAVVGGTPAEPTYQYFRFYNDATGLTVYSSGKPPQLAAWFNRSSGHVEEGKWRLDGNSLVLKIGTETKYTTYTGTLTADAWTLDPTGANPRKFQFAKVVFAPEKAQIGPKIAQQAKTTNTFSYDDMGRTVGVTTTLEIVATDPGGYGLTFNCSTSSGTVKTEGSKCIWSRPMDMGQPGHGVITVVVTNSKGAQASRQFYVF